MGFTKHVGNEMSKSEWVFILGGGSLFLFLSFLLHGYVSTATPFCEIDSSAYLHNGFLFCKHGTFSPVHAQQQLPIYALGYPLFIGLLYKLFGQSIALLIWVQVLLALLAGLLLFFAARRLFGSTVAMITYGLWSVNLGFLVFSHFILSEMLLLFFLILFFERFSIYWVTGRLLPLCCAGLALGFSVLAKAVALYFPLLLLIILGIKTTGYWRKWVILAMAFVIPFCIPILGFMVHNKVVFGQFKLTYIDSFNVQVFFYSQVLARENGTTWSVEMKRLFAVHGDNVECVKQQFLRDVVQRPSVFCAAWLCNVMKIYAGLYATSLKTLVSGIVRDGNISFFGKRGNLWQRIVAYVEDGAAYPWVKVVAWYEVVWSIVRYLLCCFGLWFLWCARQRLLMLFFLAYIFYFSFVIACDGTARYRFFFEFMLLMLAALGIKFLFDVCKKRRLA